jgi:plastocyanin
MRIHKFVLVAVGSLALWGCGGDDDADVAAVPSVVDDVLPTAPPGGDEDPGPVQVEIAIADFAFVGDTQVPVGGKVVVTNTDGASHTWTAVDGAFDSGTLAEGQSFEFTFDEPGTYEYRCNIHPTMTGTITVTG